MAIRKGGLGRGLDALLGAARSLPAQTPAATPAATPATPADGEEAQADGLLRRLPVDLVGRGRWQPRLDIDAGALEELAASIRAQGVVQPIVVRALDDGRYEIIAGERRWRAAQLAGLTEIPALVREVPDHAALAIALIENIQREDLNPLEEALALRRLIDEYDLTHQAVADAIGRSRAAVSNLLRLLELAPEARELLRSGRIEMGHARALLTLPSALQVEAARQVALRGLNVRETEALARRLSGTTAAAGHPQAAPDPDVRRLQDRLSSRLGARVQLRHGNGGKGSLVIHYNTLDELDGIIAHFGQDDFPLSS